MARILPLTGEFRHQEKGKSTPGTQFPDMGKMAGVFALALLAAPVCASAATDTAQQQLAAKMSWRNIGPFIGGRSVAVSGVNSQPNVFYFGGVQGGVWKSTDYGVSWTNITDGKIPAIADSIGAIAVVPSNPKILYAGTGESDIRSDFDTGDGIYATSDGGKTWRYAGLRDTHTTAALAIDPHDPNVVYAATMGHVFAPNAQRGVYKTTDGGRSWKRVLYVDANTGAIDVVMDPNHPRTLYAAMWQARRQPWALTSGGPGSGMYKTTDGGTHWAKISANPGFATGLLGRMGVAVSPSDSNNVYAIAQAHDGGVFRSTDGARTWKRVNSEMKLRQRAFYYMAIFADPSNKLVAYAPQVDGVYKTTDGGRTWKTISPGGDHHIVWVNPHNSDVILVGNDGGGMVTTTGGDSWSSQNNQPTGQFYHIALDEQFPFHVYGAQQDDGAFEGPSAVPGGGIPLGDWRSVASGESTFVAPEPGNPNVTYGSGYYSSMLRLDDATGEGQNVSPWAVYKSGASAGELENRFGWTHPILFSPANPHELLAVSQYVYASTDRGMTWKRISPDLTRNDKSTQGPSGGPIDFDQTSAETFPDIASLGVSPKDGSVMWAGSADGLVHVTRDHGASWTAVTPPQLPQWAQISSIEPSHTDPASAYLTANRYMWNDFHPYLYRTTDYGKTWTTLTNGLPGDQYVFVVREDPREPRLLLAGTRSNVYASFDAGQSWQHFSLNLPGVQVRDIAIDARQGQVAVATHGRSFWILDDLAMLEDLVRDPGAQAGATALFAPETAWLSHAYGGEAGDDQGENPRYGATVYFDLPKGYDGKTPASLTFEDAQGYAIRTFALHRKNPHLRQPDDEARAGLDAAHLEALHLDELTAVEPGANRFLWDLRYPPGVQVSGGWLEATDDFSNSVRGPTVLPGTYSVVLRYGGQTLRQPLRIALDPGLHPAPGDLAARLALEQQVHATADALNRTIDAALAKRPSLPPAQQAKLDEAIGGVVLLGIHSSEGDVARETKLNDHLAFLMNGIDLAYARPTAAQYAAYDELRPLAEAAIANLRAIAGLP